MAFAIAVDCDRQFAEGGNHCRRILGDTLNISQDLGQQLFDFGEGFGLDRRRELDVYPSLTDVGRGVQGLRLDALQLTGGAAVHLEDRGHDGGVANTKPVQEHRHGIHQHAAVLGDHLQRRPEPDRSSAGYTATRLSPMGRCCPSR